ncbi:hypothetical protein V502_01936 [Pseudogymnoascus sp. VKM F-4520 (FW-2644)]|nr:hypothetical protein V502_01936 [Pseudogymnoascus sp. VKM F-4520 (FW-2644)]
MFNFGRHLLVASSRDTGNSQSLAANLQGIWNEDYDPPWQSKYTNNINIEMNYWLAEVTNLQETHNALFDLIDVARGRGEDIATELYGCTNGGFMLHHNIDLWGDAAPTDYVAYGRSLALSPSHGALSLHGGQGLPEKPTGPSLSPENTFIVPLGMETAGATEAIDISPTMYNSILHELFTAVITTCSVLGIRGPDLINAQSYLEKIKPPQIGSKGQILERRNEFTEADPGHRHMGPIFGLFPGSQMTPLENSTLAAAAKVLVDNRMSSGSGSIGWSRTWVINRYARLFAADTAWENAVTFLQTFPSDNPWNTDGGPGTAMQIDGNFGFVSGIAEMLLQSHKVEHILPALPAAVPEGSHLINNQFRDTYYNITPIFCIVQSSKMPSLLAMTAGAILAVTTAVNGATLPMEIVADARNATDLPSKLQARETWCKISYEGGHSYGGGGPGQAVINIYGFGINTYDASGNFVYSSGKLTGSGPTTVSKSNWKGNYDFTVTTTYDFQGDRFTACKYQYGASLYDGTISGHTDHNYVSLKEKDKLPWDEIAEYFPERTKGTLQVHYCTKLKNRSQTSKYKERKITNSAKESGEKYPSRFSMDLLDPQLQDALLSSTSILPATADSTEDAHGSILSTTPGNIECTEVQPLRSSQGVESNLVTIDATEGRWEVEALLAKSKVGNVIWYLVKWAGFRDEDNTWQKRDDISSDLINDFEASYRGNYFGVQLLKKRERRGKMEYFVEWKGRPEAENSWEKEVTISRERILEFEAMVFTSPQFTFGIGENNVEVTVHAAAIAKQSQALDRLINGPMEEARTRIARLEDVHEDTFVRVCQFAYTGGYETPVFIQRPESSSTWSPPNVDANEPGELAEEPESEQGEPAPKLDDLSFGATRQKKHKKISKSRFLRDLFDKKDFDVVTPRLGALYRCEVRQNASAEEDYTSVFLGHARLYVFVDKWGIEALKTLSLHKLHKTLRTFTLYSARLSDVVELIRYTYAHTPDLAHDMDDLRSLVMEYLTCEVTYLSQSPEFDLLVEQGGPFTRDLVHKMMKRIG